MDIEQLTRVLKRLDTIISQQKTLIELLTPKPTKRKPIKRKTTKKVAKNDS